MSTYEEFMVILTMALLIVAILNYIKKTVSKAALFSGKVRAAYFNIAVN